MKYILSNKRRLVFTSKYNIKLYKKCLSFKLILDPKNVNRYVQPNLVFNSKSSKIKSLKCIYTRRERIPLRILRFFLLINSNINLLELRSNFVIAQRLSVYNGKELKFININQVY